MYYVEIEVKENGIPINKDGFSLLDDTSISGMKIDVYMTKNGILDLTFSTPLIKEESQTIKICSISEAIDAIANKYNNIVTNDEGTIDQVSLEYELLYSGVQGNLYLTPVYIFNSNMKEIMESTSTTELEETTYNSVIRVNAETGRLVE